MKLFMDYKTSTKTCYRFETGRNDGNLTTLYLKKADVDAAGIDPHKGITLTIEEGTGDAEG
jgi:hypothetical protein